MILIQLLPAFFLLGLARAVSPKQLDEAKTPTFSNMPFTFLLAQGPLLERRESRAECLARHALESDRRAPSSDVTICYSAHPDVRDRSPNKYGYIDTFKCPGTA